MGVKASLQNLNPVQSVQDRFTRLIEFYHPKAWRERGIGWTLGLFVVTYLIVVMVLGFVWSRSPATFDVRANALAAVGGDESRLVTGAYTTATAIRIGKTLLEKPGGYLSNDIFPPGVYMAIDFESVLKKKNAQVSLNQIVRKLLYRPRQRGGHRSASPAGTGLILA